MKRSTIKVGKPYGSSGGGGGGTEYTAGNGITISEHVISADTEVVATKTDLTAKQNVLTAGTGITLSSDTVAADTEVMATKSDLTGKQDTLTAGTGISLSSNTVAADTAVLATKTDLNSKQNTLVSGTNIKTINNTSILGAGNIDIQGGSSYTFGKGLKFAPGNNVPALSADGTVGGAEPACEATSTEGGRYTPYKAFTANVTDYWGPSSGNIPESITYYNPTAVAIDHIVYNFSNNTSENFTAATIYGSNDNSAWTEIGSYSNQTSATVIVNIASVATFKYIKTTFTAKGGSGYGKTHITITTKSTTNIMTDIDDSTIMFDGNKMTAAVPAGGEGIEKALGNHTHVDYLSATGTMGGSTAACYCEDNSNAYKSYSSNASEFWGPGGWVDTTTTYYSPVAITVSKVKYTGGTLPQSCTLSASNDNSTWVDIGSYSGGSGGAGTSYIYPTTGAKYKYFRSHFVGNTGYGHAVHIDIYSGETVMNVRYDDNTIKLNGQNKIYAVPQETFDIEAPLKYNLVSVGGMTNYTISSGHIVPTYPNNLSFYGISDGLVQAYKNEPAQTMTALFTDASYIDIPCDIGSKVKKAVNGEISSMNCLFSSFMGSSDNYQSANWIAGKWDGTTFTPILYASASGYMGASLSFLDGTYRYTDEYTYGFPTYDTSTTSGTTSLGSGAHLAFTYNGTNFKVETSAITYRYATSMNTTSLTTDHINKLKQINVVRFVNSSGSSTAEYNPLVEGFGYNNSTWTPADGAQVQKTMTSEYHMPIGTIYSVNCTASYVPSGALPCDGAEYTKAQFTDLWNNYLNASTPLLKTCTYAEYQTAITTYGQCPMFAIDTTNNKFKAPTIKDGAYITQAKSDSELGKSYNESLPNITGGFGCGIWGSATSGSGAFADTTSQYQGTLGTNSSAFYYNGVDFKASNSSSTYQTDAVVQGNNVRARYFIQVATGTINQSQMDWSAWASSLQGKLNTNGTNLGTGQGTGTVRAVVETSAKSILPSWYRVYSDGWCEQGGQVTYASSHNGDQSISFAKTFSDTNYSVSLAKRCNTNYDSTVYATKVKTWAASSMVVTVTIDNGGAIDWEVKGYIN